MRLTARCGASSRHDRNTVGTADRFLLGLLGNGGAQVPSTNGTGARLRRPAPIRSAPWDKQDDLAALGRAGHPFVSKGAGFAGSDDRAHECALGFKAPPRPGMREASTPCMCCLSACSSAAPAGPGNLLFMSLERDFRGKRRSTSPLRRPSSVCSAFRSGRLTRRLQARWLSADPTAPALRSASIVASYLPLARASRS